MYEKPLKGSTVEVRNGDINGAMRRLKKLLHRDNWHKDIARHTFYEKPCKERKRKKEQGIRNANKKRAHLIEKGIIVNHLSVSSKKKQTSKTTKAKPKYNSSDRTDA